MRRSLLIRMALLLRPVVLSCLLAAPCSLLSRGGAAAPSSEKQIEQWIEDLGSDRFEIREAATRALMEREEAAAALQKALRSPDAEVRRRAARILEVLKPKRARRALARAYALGKEGRIVETVDRLVYWREWDKDNEGWDTLTRFADELMERVYWGEGDEKETSVTLPRFADQLMDRTVGAVNTPRLPAGDFRRYRAKMQESGTRQLKEISGRKVEITRAPTVLARGEQIIIKRSRDSDGSITSSIVVASEDIQIDNMSDSLIVAGGDIKVGTLHESLLICDGDIELLTPPRGGLIIARGEVTCRNRKLTDKRIIIKDGTPDLLGGFVKFFELSDVGLTVSDRDQKDEPIQNGVRLKDVRKDSPFASGLRAGDVVTALDGTKATSPEVLRRLLRRKLGQGDPVLTFTVRRAERTVDVPIPIKD